MHIAQLKGRKPARPVRVIPALPECKTHFGDRSAGKRFASKVDKDADIGSLDPHLVEFILALDKAKREKGRMLVGSEIYQVVVGVLGYHRPKPKRVRPKRRRFKVQCERCEGNLEGRRDIVRYKDKTYCPTCEPFIEKDDTWFAYQPREGEEEKEAC